MKESERSEEKGDSKENEEGNTKKRKSGWRGK